MRPDELAGARVLVAGAGVSGLAAAAALVAVGARVTVTDARPGRAGRPARRRRARRRPRRSAGGHRARRHLARAGGRTTRWSPRPPRRECRWWGSRSSPGGSGRPGRTPADVARGHRHQRQDHHRRHAGGDPARRRPRRGGLRQHRLPGRGGRAGGARGAGRGAVQLPAALVAVDPPAAGLRAQRGRGPPRLARLDGRLRRREGPGAARRPVAVAGVDDPAAAALLAASPAPRRVGRHAAASRHPASSGSSTGCWSTAPSATTERARRSRRPPCTRRAPPGITDALAAAALARAARRWARTPSRAGLADFRPGPHRGAVVATVARRPLRRRLQGHQPARRRAPSLAAQVPHAGRVDRRRAAQGRLGRRRWSPRHAGAAARRRRDRHRSRRDHRRTARHAPDVPVAEVDRRATMTSMTTAVRRAAALARPGDVVLLAPAAASMDQFADYAERGRRVRGGGRRAGRRRSDPARIARIGRRIGRGPVTVPWPRGGARTRAGGRTRSARTASTSTTAGPDGLRARGRPRGRGARPVAAPPAHLAAPGARRVRPAHAVRAGHGALGVVGGVLHRRRLVVLGVHPAADVLRARPAAVLARACASRRARLRALAPAALVIGVLLAGRGAVRR